MKFSLPDYSNKVSPDEFFKQLRAKIEKLDLKVVEENLEKPWGGYIRFDSQDIEKYVPLFFPGLKLSEIGSGEFSPKLLVLKPNTRFSWQVHQRRKEIWRVIHGPAGVFLNTTDDIPEQMDMMNEGETVMVEHEVRHRLVALDKWIIVAEIWIHTDPTNPTDENDLRRVHDDFGRV